MRGLVENVSRPDYAKIAVALIKTDRGSIRVDLPLRVLEEAEVDLREGSAVEVEVSGEVGDIDEWKIALSGRVYAIGEDKILASFGGLQAVIEDPELLERFRVGDKIYLLLGA